MSNETQATTKARFKARYGVAAVVCVGAIVWMLTSLSTNLNYLKPVSEAVAQRSSDGDRTFRMGGVVLPKSIDVNARTGARFKLSDGVTTVSVQLVGAEPPQLFKECAPIVVEGHWQADVFVGSNIVVKHGATYDSHNRKVTDARTATGCAKDA